MAGFVARLAIGLVVLAAGCGAAPPSPPAPGGMAEVILGGGGAVFIPVADGDAVPIIHGPQGGYHIWGSVLLRGIAGAHAALTFTITRAGDGVEVANIGTHARLSALDPTLLALDGGTGDATLVLDGSPADWLMSTGSYVFLKSPTDVAGQVVVMAVDAVGEVAGHGRDQKRIVPFQQ